MSPRDLPTSATKPRLGIRLFGHVKIELDGAPFNLQTPRRSLALLTFLTLNRTSAIEREFVAFALWPDEDETSARTKLRATLNDLQRVLPPNPDGWLDVNGNTLRLRADADIELDIERFELLARDPATVREAVELYRGDLVEALYDEWIDEPRERLRNVYLTSLNRLVTEARRGGDFPLAIASARRLLAADPWREDVVRRVMSLHFESGDRAGALAEYRRFSEALRKEMGVEPMPETQMLMESIVREHGAAAPGDAVDLDGHPASRTTPVAAFPFVGREVELARALECWDQGARGFGQLVGIGGEAGIGKSRLAREFVHAIEERGGRAMWGATGRPESAPYEPLVDALRSALPLLAALPLSPSVASVLAALVPELGARLPDLQPLVPLDPFAERERLFGAIATAFAQMAKTRPIVLVLEDLQWAGEATLDALAFVAQRLRSTRSTIVLTYREEATPRHHPLRRMLREGAAATSNLALGPIDIAAVETLMQARLGQELAHPPELVHERAGGNPLFLVQLLVGKEALLGGTLPQTLADLIGERLAALSPEATTLAEIAAAIGERFSLDVAREVLGWHDGDTLRAIDELIDRRIVRERGGRGLFSYAFDHQLIQQAINDGSPPERRVARHRRIATVLDALFPDRKDELAGEIARHYDRGSEPGLAIQHYLAAAKHAMALGANDEVNAFVTRGLELTPDDRMHIELLFVREQFSQRAGVSETHLATLDELTRLADGTGDASLKCDVLARRVTFMYRHAEDAAQQASIAALRAEAARAGDARWLAKADFLDAYRLDRVATAAEAIAAATRARDGFLHAGDARGASQAASLVVQMLAYVGRIAEAKANLDDALELAARDGSYSCRGRALLAEADIARLVGDYRAMVTAAESLLELVNAAGDVRAAVSAKGQIALARSHGLELGPALRLFDEVLVLAEELDLPSHHYSHLHDRGVLLARIGDLAAAATAFEDSAKLSESRGDQRIFQEARADLCIVRAYLGDHEAALAAGNGARASAALSGFVMTETSALEHLAETELLAGDADSAREHARQALTSRIEFGGAHRLGTCRVLHGRAALAARDVDAAFEAIESLAPENPLTFAGALWPERVAWDAACIARAAGRTGDARKWQARAVTLTTEMRASLEATPDLLPAFDALPWRAEILSAST